MAGVRERAHHGAMARTPDTDTTDTGSSRSGSGRSDSGPRRGGRGFRRQMDGHLLGGVATGLADALDLDLSVVRVAFVALTFLGGLAVPVYAAAWLLVPEEGSDHALINEFWPHRAAA